MTLSKRPTPWMVSTSVLIPCTTKHVPLLAALLSHYAAQTTKPNEVVIAISGTDVVPRLSPQPYRLHVLTDPLPAYAGKNRNRAADASSGDVLIYQDADDVPHPQRIEIAKYLFGNFFVEHLLHTYTKAEISQTWLAQRHTPTHVTARACYEAYSYTHEFTNGNVMTTREVFRRVRWPEDIRRGQDVVYNHSVRDRFPKRMVRLGLPLLTYRQHLSSRA